MTTDTVIMTASNAGGLTDMPTLYSALCFWIYNNFTRRSDVIVRRSLLKKTLGLKVSILYLPVTIIRLMKSLFQNKKFQTKHLKL